MGKAPHSCRRWALGRLGHAVRVHACAIEWDVGFAPPPFQDCCPHWPPHLLRFSVQTQLTLPPGVSSEAHDGYQMGGCQGDKGTLLGKEMERCSEMCVRQHGQRVPWARLELCGPHQRDSAPVRPVGRAGGVEGRPFRGHCSHQREES